MSILSKYIKTIWSNNTDPAINETNKNKVENQLETLTDQVNDNYDQGQENKNSISSLLSRLLNAIGKDSLSEVQDARNSAAKGINYTVLDDRLEAIDSEIVDARDSAVKSKVFTDIDERLEEIEQDKVNAIDNSFYADINAYYGNVKTADDFQDESLWTIISGSQTVDTTNVKIGNNSIRITETDNTASALRSKLDGISLDFSTLNNGKPSTDDDYIILPIYISDASFVADIQFAFSQDSIFSTTNIKNIVFNSGFVTGWNYLKAKKSTASTGGTGSWSGIQSIRITWTSVSNALNQYVSFQLIQLVKKDPLADYPNPFQKFGAREFAINSGEWFVGEEFGKVILKELGNGGLNERFALLGTKNFSNFTAYRKTIVDGSSDTGNLSFYVDASNFATLQINNVSTNEVRFEIVESGVSTIYNANLDTSNGDIVELFLIKDGTNIIAKARNGVAESIISQTATLGSGVLANGIRSVEQSYILSSSITEISHAHHCDISETSKRLLSPQKNGAFIASELEVNQIGFDYANYRTYTKFSDGTLAYVQWTTV